MEKFSDRQQAGEILAKELKEYANEKDAILLALPRGGVPVAFEIAMSLSLPLDVFVVRKLGVPGHEELAMGAIASGGVAILNDSLIEMLGISQFALDQVIKSEQEELSRRESLYRSQPLFDDLKGKIILLIDDGIATGYTMKAAISALRQQNPAKIILAVPVAAQDTCREMEAEVDRFICPLRPINFYAVGLWYDNFSQTTDREVCELLKIANEKYKFSKSKPSN